MEMFTEAKSLATRENAVKKLQRVCGDSLANMRWFIIATADGRFVPCVAHDQRGHFSGIYLAERGICVVG